MPDLQSCDVPESERSNHSVPYSLSVGVHLAFTCVLSHSAGCDVLFSAHNCGLGRRPTSNTSRESSWLFRLQSLSICGGPN